MRFDDTNLVIFHFTGIIFKSYMGKSGHMGVVRANNDFIAYSWVCLESGYIPKDMDRVKIKAVEYYPNRFLIINMSKYS